MAVAKESPCATIRGVVWGRIGAVMGLPTGRENGQIYGGDDGIKRWKLDSTGGRR